MALCRSVGRGDWRSDFWCSWWRGAAQTPSGPDHSYQLSDLEGQWTWTQDPWFGDFAIAKDANSYAGTLNDVYEGTYGDKMVDIALSNNHISFTRDGKYGIQYWDGTLIEEEGVLKIVDGFWIKTSGEGGSFSAEKIYSSPVNLGPNVNADGDEGSPDISSDGLTLYYDSFLAGRDLWVTRRADPNADWQQPIHLGVPFNTTGTDTDPSLSADGSWLYFVSDRSGGRGGFDIWVLPMKKQE